MKKLADLSAFEALSSQNCSVNNSLFDPVKRVWDKGVNKVYEHITERVLERQLQQTLADEQADLARWQEEVEKNRNLRKECDKEAEDLIKKACARYDQMCANIRRYQDLPKPVAYTSVVDRLEELEKKRPYTNDPYDPYWEITYEQKLWNVLRGSYNYYKRRILDRWKVDYSGTQYNPVKEGLSKVLRKVIPPKKVDNSRTYHRNKVSLTNRGFGGFDLGSRGGDVRERKHLDSGIESRHLSDEKQPVHGGTQKELHDKYISKATPVDGKYGKWASEIPVSDDDQQKARALLRECKSRVLRAVNGVDDTAPPENPANGEEEHIKQGDWVGLAKAAGIDIGKLLGKNY